jgi:hypothetical protein
LASTDLQESFAVCVTVSIRLKCAILPWSEGGITSNTAAKRAKHLGDARPSSATLIVNALVVPEWLIEIEAVAAAKA